MKKHCFVWVYYKIELLFLSGLKVIFYDWAYYWRVWHISPGICYICKCDLLKVFIRIISPLYALFRIFPLVKMMLNQRQHQHPLGENRWLSRQFHLLLTKYPQAQHLCREKEVKMNWDKALLRDQINGTNLSGLSSGQHQGKVWRGWGFDWLSLEK